MSTAVSNLFKRTRRRRRGWSSSWPGCSLSGCAWRGASAQAAQAGDRRWPRAPRRRRSRTRSPARRDSYADVVKVVVAGRRDDSHRGQGEGLADRLPGRRPAAPLLRRPVRRRRRTPGAHAHLQAARARLGRDRQPRRLHPDQLPRRRRRRRDPRRPDGRPHARREARRHGQAERSRAAEDRRDGPPSAGARRLRRGAGRRRRARRRQPARHRPDRDDGDHQREGAVDRRRRRQLRGLPADRRADQPRQLGRRARRTRGASSSASTRRSSRTRTATSGSASRFRPTWRAT